MRVYEGVVKDRVVVPPEDVLIDEGVRVEVRVHEVGQGSSEDHYKQKLVEAGIVKEIKRPREYVLEDDRTPIRVEGEPLSKMIIKERR